MATVPTAQGAAGPGLPTGVDTTQGGVSGATRKLVEREIQRTVQAEVNEYQAALTKRQATMMAGYSQRKGKNAIGVVDEAQDEWTKGLDDLRGEHLSSPLSRRASSKMELAMGASMAGKLAVHQERQTHEWRVDSVASASNSEAQLVAQGGDIEDSFMRLDKLADDLADLKGMDQGQRDAVARDFKGEAIKERIETVMSAAGADPAEAEALLKQYKGVIGSDDYQRLNSQISKGVLLHKAESNAIEAEKAGKSTKETVDEIRSRTDLTQTEKDVHEKAVHERFAQNKRVYDTNQASLRQSLNEQATEAGVDVYALSRKNKEAGILFNQLDERSKDFYKGQNDYWVAWNAAKQGRLRADANRTLLARKSDRYNRSVVGAHKDFVSRMQAIEGGSVTSQEDIREYMEYADEHIKDPKLKEEFIIAINEKIGQAPSAASQKQKKYDLKVLGQMSNALVHGSKPGKDPFGIAKGAGVDIGSSQRTGIFGDTKAGSKAEINKINDILANEVQIELVSFMQSRDTKPTSDEIIQHGRQYLTDRINQLLEVHKGPRGNNVYGWQLVSQVPMDQAASLRVGLLDDSGRLEAQERKNITSAIRTIVGLRSGATRRLDDYGFPYDPTSEPTGAESLSNIDDATDIAQGLMWAYEFNRPDVINYHLASLGISPESFDSLINDPTASEVLLLRQAGEASNFLIEEEERRAKVEARTTQKLADLQEHASRPGVL